MPGRRGAVVAVRVGASAPKTDYSRLTSLLVPPAAGM
jgi:hypothetical protein